MSTDPILDTPRCVQDLQSQMGIQETTWRAQRIGWWVMLLFSLCGFLGVLGNGPLARTTTQSGQTEVDYEYILRKQRQTTVTFHMAEHNGHAVLTLPRSYLEAADITDVQPDPVATFSGPETMTYVFPAPEGRTWVRLNVQPQQIGVLDFAPRANGQPLPTRSPFVLP